MDRREFLAAAAAVAVPSTVPAGGSLDGLDLIAPTDPPARVGVTEIAQVRDTAQAIKRGDMRWGGGFGFDAALVEARRARDLLDARCPDSLRADLLVAVGWLTCNAGFMAFDIDRYRDASRLWDLAQRCALDADSWSLNARILGSMARQALWLDRADDALGLTSHGIEGDRHGQLVPTELAMLWALKARAHAQIGDADATEQAIGTADHFFSLRDLSECADRPWAAHYSHAHHWGDTGLAWERLALTGLGSHAIVEAGGRQQASADGHGTDAARSHALALSGLAKLDTAVGDLDRGVQVGHRAVDAAQSVRSGRVREELVKLHDATTVHQSRKDVAELQDRITTLLVA
jgi:hypothetical protein